MINKEEFKMAKKALNHYLQIRRLKSRMESCSNDFILYSGLQTKDMFDKASELTKKREEEQDALILAIYTACARDPRSSPSSNPSNRRIALKVIAAKKLEEKFKNHSHNTSEWFIKFTKLIPSEEDISFMVNDFADNPDKLYSDYNTLFTDCENILIGDHNYPACSSSTSCGSSSLEKN
jgi:hypothetical protein